MINNLTVISAFFIKHVLAPMRQFLQLHEDQRILREVYYPSPRHLSTGSTVPTCLTQGVLQERYNFPIVLPVIREEQGGSDDDDNDSNWWSLREPQVLQFLAVPPCCLATSGCLSVASRPSIINLLLRSIAVSELKLCGVFVIKNYTRLWINSWKGETKQWCDALQKWNRWTNARKITRKNQILNYISWLKYRTNKLKQKVTKVEIKK